MSNNVIILGAGFSHSAGIPLLRGLAERMWDLASRGAYQGRTLGASDIEVFRKALDVRNDLDSYHGRASFDDRNIEDILSLLSFNVLAGEDNGAEKLKAVNHAIARAIDLTCEVTWPGGDNIPVEPTGSRHYRDFWQALVGWAAGRSNEPLPTIITLNYDLVLERSLVQLLNGRHYARPNNPFPFDSICFRYHYPGFPNSNFTVEYVDYMLNHQNAQGSRLRLTPTAGGRCANIELLKLHGSVNFPVGEGTENDEKDRLTDPLPDPYILPPIFSKLSMRSADETWKVALNRLRSARNIIVVGYSLPKTDIYMQYFLKAALGPNRDLERIFVFDPILYNEVDPGEKEMKARFEDCFVPQIRQRVNFKPPVHQGLNYGNSWLGTTAHFVAQLKSEPHTILY